MSKKPTVVFTRWTGWDRHGSDKLDLVYVPVAGADPKRSNGKRPAGDAAQAAVTKKGIDLLLQTLRKRRPEVLLRWANTKLSPKTMAAMREASPGTLIMCADGNDPHTASRYFTRFREYIDVALLNSYDPETIKAYEREGIPVDTLWDGYHPELFPAARGKHTHDCFFAGSNRRTKAKTGKYDDPKWDYDFPEGPLRFAFIQEVNKRFKLKLHGRQKEWPFRCGPTLYHPKFWAEFQKCRAVLGCNHYYLRRYYTRRLLHSGGSGRLFITKYIPGMGLDFENGKNIVWFKTVQEGVELIAKYLKDDTARERVAMEQERWFCDRHSWRARIADVERIVERFL